MARWAEVMDAVVRDRLPSLVGYAYLVCGSAAEAEDIAQEAIVKTFARGRRGLAVETAEAYVRKAIVNEAINRSRHRSMAAGKNATIAQAASTPSHESWVAQQADTVAALEELSVRERACVVLKYYEDRTVAEIAEHLKLSDGTVKRYLFNAAGKLRDHLGSDVIDVEPPHRIDVVGTRGGAS